MNGLDFEKHIQSDWDRRKTKLYGKILILLRWGGETNSDWMRAPLRDSVICVCVFADVLNSSHWSQIFTFLLLFCEYRTFNSFKSPFHCSYWLLLLFSEMREPDNFFSFNFSISWFLFPFIFATVSNVINKKQQ